MATKRSRPASAHTRQSFTRNIQIPENPSGPTSLEISTKCPLKWAFVDMETGHIWHFDPNREFLFGPLAQQYFDEIKAVVDQYVERYRNR